MTPSYNDLNDPEPVKMLDCDVPRDCFGRFVALVCVKAHDLCYLGGPCPYCEPKSPK